ncbi:epoxyqueuosine reductase [Sedimenticola sp.]|uniref:epoxyqueuosine reductase n=1 Tax=Sedimenticola sp. TaxID=1940285 RepID=UPI003D0E058D
MTFTDTIKQTITQLGADLVGIADADPLRALKTDPPDLLQPYTRAVAIALRVPNDVFETIQEQPTPIYATAYQASNRILDEIALKAANHLQHSGYRALPVPAAQILDRQNWYGAISHKAVARLAGLGWQGKNLLLITPEYGSRVRLVTLLTDAPLAVDAPIENLCGKCRLCVDACPVDAIHNVNTDSHYSSREEAIDLQRCAEKVTVEFAGLPHIGAPMCGICIKVCPFGRRIRRVEEA